MSRPLKIYTAGDLGFHEAGRKFLPGYVDALQEMGYEILNPWELTKLEEVQEYMNSDRKEELWRLIGFRNEEAINQADAITANLDGWDTGTASELGFAACLGKPIHAFLTDWRTYGELDCRINVQVLHFTLRNEGSTMSYTLEQHLKAMQAYLI